MIRNIFFNKYDELKGIWVFSLIIFGIIAVLILFISPLLYIENVACSNRYPNLENTYRVSSGCLILVDGNYIPEENFIFNTPQ